MKNFDEMFRLVNLNALKGELMIQNSHTSQEHLEVGIDYNRKRIKVVNEALSYKFFLRSISVTLEILN